MSKPKQQMTQTLANEFYWDKQKDLGMVWENGENTFSLKPEIKKEIEAVIQLLKGGSKTKFLKIRGIEILEYCDKETRQTFVEALKMNKSLTHLEIIVRDFYQLEITDIDIALREFLQNNTNIISFVTNCCSPSRGQGQEFIQGLSINSSLRNLDLSFCDFHGDGVAILFSALSLENSKVESLNLSKTRVYDDGAKIIGDFLANNSHLKALDLSRCGITSDGIIAIAEGLKRATTERKNTISSSSAPSISASCSSASLPAAAKNQNSNSTDLSGLESLSLAGNHLDSLAVTPLFDALDEDKVIKFLNLSYFNINITDGSGAVERVAQLLIKNRHLKSLNLAGNNIARDIQGISHVNGFKSIIDALLVQAKENKERITQMALSSFKDEKQNVEALEISGLESINLSGIGLAKDLEVGSLINRLLVRNNILKEFYFDDNETCTNWSAGLETLSLGLRNNETLETLSLRSTPSSDEGENLFFIFKSLNPEYNQTLTALDLSGTSLEPFAMGENQVLPMVPSLDNLRKQLNIMEQMLKANKALIFLDLSRIRLAKVHKALIFSDSSGKRLANVYFEREWIKALVSGLKENQNLQTLIITNLGRGEVCEILDAVGQNKYRALTTLRINEANSNNQDLTKKDTIRRDQLMERNRFHQLTWSFAAITLAYGRANNGNPLGKASILPLLPEVRASMGVNETTFCLSFDKFVNTRYYQNVTKEPLKAKMATTPKAKSAIDVNALD